jgi:hypothetical protein
MTLWLRIAANGLFESRLVGEAASGTPKEGSSTAWQQQEVEEGEAADSQIENIAVRASCS